MGGCCYGRRHENQIHEKKSSLLFNLPTFQDPKTQSEDEVKSTFVKAYKEENLSELIKLLDSQCRISIEMNPEIDNLVQPIYKPILLGELVLMKIFNICKSVIIPIEDDPLLQNKKVLTEPSPIDLKKDEIIGKLKESYMIERLLIILEQDKSSKKDIAMLLISTLSEDRRIIKLFQHREIMQGIVSHINSFKNVRYKNYKQHVIAGLQILRRIYVKSVKMRVYFLEIGGIQVIYYYLASGDENIVQEVLYNIEDLIYHDDEVVDFQSSSVSTIIIAEMIEKLIKLNIENMLVKLIAEIKQNPEKYSCIGLEMKRLLILFGNKINLDNEKCFFSS